MGGLDYIYYCRSCRKLVKVQEGERERGVLPEGSREFDVVAWCCSVCGGPIVEVSVLSKARGGEGRSG